MIALSMEIKLPFTIILLFSLIFIYTPSYGNGSVFYGIDFLDDLHGCVVGAGGAIFYTKDGGQTWESLFCGSRYYPVDICLTDEKEIWLLSSNGIIFHTRNCGITWSHYFCFLQT